MIAIDNRESTVPAAHDSQAYWPAISAGRDKSPKYLHIFRFPEPVVTLGLPLNNRLLLSGQQRLHVNGWDGMARARAQDYDAKRLAILHRSAELFAQHGYAGTSIRMVAEACGVSKALLYHYYTDKEAVLFDILFHHFSDLIAAVEEAARSESDPTARVYVIVAALLESYRDADAEHQVQLANLRHLPSKQQMRLKDMERTIVAVLSDALAKALPAAARGPLLKPLTMSVFGMLNWHYLWFREDKGLTRREYAHLAARLVLAGAAEATASLTRERALLKRVKTRRRVAVRNVTLRA